MEHQYDTVVIGGGVVGWSAAYRLIRGGAKVAVVDDSSDGRATAAGAGIVSPGTGVRAHHDAMSLTKAAAGWYPTLLSHLEEDGETETGFASPGTLFVFTDDDEYARRPEVEAHAERLLNEGVACIGTVSSLSGSEAKELFPALADIPGALYMSEGSRVDGRLLANSMRQAATRRGAVTIQATAVADDHTLQHRRLVAGSQSVGFDTLLVAAGAWTRALLRPMRIEVPVDPQRGQILHFSVPDNQTSTWPVIHGFHNHYLLAFPEYRVVAGATREDGSGFDYRMTAGGVSQELNEALRVAPGLASATLDEIRVGFRPMSADGLPILGRVPGHENLFIATGHGPSGLTLGAVSGAAVADAILGDSPVAPIAPYAIDRFM